MLLALLVAACNGSDGALRGTQSITATVMVSWAPNREADVNTAGGGYKVYYSQTPDFDVANANVVNVPYVSGPTAPTNAMLTLSSGDNFIKVVAYSALNPNGSQPSAQISVNVPFTSTLAAVARHG